MSHPGEQKPSWSAILRVNLQMAGACLTFGYGWICWNAASAPRWGLWLIGGMCFGAGAIMMIKALWEAGRLILMQSRWRRFRKLGDDPRADSLASEADLRQGGRIR